MKLLEQKIINGTKHDRDYDPLVLSASMLGNTLLQTYYMFLHGPQEKNEISATYL